MGNWTTQATVIKHLIVSDYPGKDIVNERITLLSEDDTQLQHVSISDLVVKTIDQSNVQGPTSITLTGTDWTSLPSANTIRGTIFITSDEAGVAIPYTEGDDFYVDWDNGRIRRVANSGISSGVAVYISYLISVTRILDTDYTADLDNGLVARISGGSIDDGQQVYCSYSVGAGSVNGAMIDQCILEAEDIIEQRLTDDYSTSSEDQGLETGATHLAISLVCRDKAAEAMLSNMNDDADAVAKSWMSLSDKYETFAYEVLDRFFDPIDFQSGQTFKTHIPPSQGGSS